MNETTVVYEGKYLRVNKTGNWEWVQRNNCNGAVVIVPITDEDELIFVEQHRVPLGAPCIEFPAGLVGDIQKDETARESAIKELWEETGYKAEELEIQGEYYSSPGLTDEVITYCLAHGLTKVGEGGGDETEDITVHVVNGSEVHNWLDYQRELGKTISSNVPSGLNFYYQMLF